MRTTCNLIINGRSVDARIGETLVDAGLGGWIAIPHDCCSGQCETCRVEVVSGRIDDQGTRDGRSVLACQATVLGDAEIRFEEVPVTAKESGRVTEISVLASDVVEVVVALNQPINYRPGQYLGVKFSGFPARDLSPALREDGSARDRELVFHIRRYPGGVVSTQLGATIRPGHRVQVRGPFGYAYLREGAGRSCWSPEAPAGRRSGRSPAPPAASSRTGNWWSLRARAISMVSTCAARSTG